MSTKHAVHHHPARPALVRHTYQPQGLAAHILGGITTLFLHPKTQEFHWGIGISRALRPRASRKSMCTSEDDRKRMPSR
jgi:hypothetical protein